MTDPLWSETELAQALGAPPSAPLSAAVAGVSIDTRTLAPGDLFFAIQGETSDGHDYVARAFAAGASACVVAQTRARELAAHGPVFAVDDTLRAMERLGAAARARTHARIVAVTGSVGKTSAKEMLRVALAKAGPTHASAASYNNHWGVPLTLARMPASSAFGVFEIGMNHAGEITPLVAMVRPHVALVTTIAPVHIEYLGSIEAIAEAKAEIFTGVELGGTIVLNRDAPQFALLERRASLTRKVVSFGADARADGRLLHFEPEGEGAAVRAVLHGREIAFRLGAPGLHMAQNAVGVLLAVEALGADVAQAAAALAEFSAQKGRGARFTLHGPGGAFTLIDESYNANPVSMRAALALLSATNPGAGGRRIAVLGDMLELGAGGAQAHADLAGDLARHNVDLLFCVGPLMRRLFDAAPPAMRGFWAERSADIAPSVFDAARGGDVVMVKGSLGSAMGPVVAALRSHFSLAPAGE
ncbi:UDP-N-acetylmuramoylalanyl-D-glutamyl-2,6-diaminopimelate--D-alanyl-D-alanine ligase [Methylocapsa sp. S129]|uniref:UDP-N-acetylmuramoylalanyl-D-glutamyl-2, 6-diaminopimelate--D-alanyl-D-alanine ligase n=1 Tax=Methylocapsa sp. S129 TaxID=1641869 RepID=UPI00131BBD00|nr:UDP-N-acetylmuramoylalanyl-D-glutamyl-2,6-diaminopimelate--D-alanyl-D-alanine ligase [Methylocapsa sp. S129]